MKAKFNLLMWYPQRIIICEILHDQGTHKNYYYENRLNKEIPLSAIFKLKLKFMRNI
jgi:hypothetical protein